MCETFRRRLHLTQTTMGSNVCLQATCGHAPGIRVLPGLTPSRSEWHLHAGNNYRSIPMTFRKWVRKRHERVCSGSRYSAVMRSGGLSPLMFAPGCLGAHTSVRAGPGSRLIDATQSGPELAQSGERELNSHGTGRSAPIKRVIVSRANPPSSGLPATWTMSNRRRDQRRSGSTRHETDAATRSQLGRSNPLVLRRQRAARAWAANHVFTVAARRPVRRAISCGKKWVDGRTEPRRTGCNFLLVVRVCTDCIACLARGLMRWVSLTENKHRMKAQLTLAFGKDFGKEENCNVRTYLLTIGLTAALGMALGARTLAVAQFNPWSALSAEYKLHMRSMTDNWRAPNAVGQLASNEGIYVDAKGFKINKGTAKGDPSEQIKKSGAREVSNGAIIFRSGEKLYIVDGKPPQ